MRLSTANPADWFRMYRCVHVSALRADSDETIETAEAFDGVLAVPAVSVEAGLKL